jgi:hypothetical protein
MRTLIIIILCSVGLAHAQTSDFSASLSLGHQACLAEGGADCSEKEDGITTAISVDYSIWSWLDVGIESGFGRFPGDDGYTTLSALGVISAKYHSDWLNLTLIGNVGGGLVNVSHTRAELGVGDVTYDYTSVAAMRFGGGLAYDVNKQYSIGLLSHLLISGTGEVCTEIGGREPRCSEDQDLIDLWTTSARISYRF